MFFIAARKDTQVELEKGGNSLDFTNETQKIAVNGSITIQWNDGRIANII